MSGVATLRRRQRHERRNWNRHITKAEHIETYFVMADSLAKYADRSDECRAHALGALDAIEELRISPRCGWYPARPKGWKP